MVPGTCGDQKRTLAVCLMLSTMVWMPALSQSPPTLTVIGVGGGVSCAEWVAEGSGDTGVEQWAFGYLSAMAANAQIRTGTDPLKHFNRAAIQAWLHAYCTDHGEDSLSVALVRLVFDGQR